MVCSHLHNHILGKLFKLPDDDGVRVLSLDALRCYLVQLLLQSKVKISLNTSETFTNTGNKNEKQNKFYLFNCSVSSIAL